MTRLSRRGLILLPVAAALSGCVTLLPKQKEVRMYRFIFDPSVLEPEFDNRAGAGDKGTAFAMSIVDFPQASRGDRMLTVEGSELSYIAGARWAAPAQELFNNAISEGFARSAKGVRVEQRGPGAAPYRLELFIRRFEAVYGKGRPTITVAADVRIVSNPDRRLVGQRFIVNDIAVRRNNVSDMVAAYSRATTQIIAGVIAECEKVAVEDTPPEAAA